MVDPVDNGIKILNSYAFKPSNGWMGPGHNGIIQDGDNYYMIHHAREPVWIHLHVRKILWIGDGWPIVSPERYAGEVEQPIPEKEIPGVWEHIVLLKDDNRQLKSSTLKLLPEAKIDTERHKGSWKMENDNILQITWEHGYTDTVKVIPAWDWENGNPTLVYAGLNQAGTAVWGKKVVE